jgi:hypothetical protein
MPKLDPVPNSSNIAATGHDPDSNTLYVKFHSGSVYSYPGVGAHEHAAMRAAPSVGKHFHQFIKHRGGEQVS